MSIEVKLDTKELDRLIKESPALVDKAVRTTAFQVQAIAQSLSPVMTGANRSSIYTKTSAGQSGSPGDAGDVLPGAGLLTAYVGPSMAYSARLEFGFSGADALGRTYSQAGRPYLTPAIEQANGLFGGYVQEYLK